MNQGPFTSVSWEQATPLSVPDDAFGTCLRVWACGSLELPAGASHYGFIDQGPARITCESGSYELQPGMYFALPGPGRLDGPGRGIVIARPGHRCLFALGGPIEEQGRLRYVDGCTDTLLLSPARVGAPCLNLLHLPPGTHQTAHTHPSVRVGMTVSGRGHCLTPDGIFELSPSQIFVIQADGEHCFQTDQEALRVIAYHPDSDTGPSDGDHPMINRTFVGGRSAATLPSIRTRKPMGDR
ncbi:MAG: hypothetical protein VX498_11600, partial [Myxococcota bacterium]|nr:hypothetical protein [Myxococcota bacterium]